MTTEKGLFREVNSDLLSDGDVRGQHELHLSEYIDYFEAVGNIYLLNQRVGLGALIRTTVNGMATLIKREVQLERLASDCTGLEAALTKLLGEVVEDLDVVRDVFCAVFRGNSDFAEGLAVDNVLHVVVAQLRSRPTFGRQIKAKNSPSSDSLDDRPAEPFLDDLALFRHREDNREGKALLAGKKAAELLAQGGRKHRHGALDEVDTGSTLARIAVESSVGLDKVGNVGDVNPNVIRAVLVDLNGESVVEILGSVGIDSEDTLATEILANLELMFRYPRTCQSKKLD